MVVIYARASTPEEQEWVD